MPSATRRRPESAVLCARDGCERQVEDQKALRALRRGRAPYCDARCRALATRRYGQVVRAPGVAVPLPLDLPPVKRR